MGPEIALAITAVSAIGSAAAAGFGAVAQNRALEANAQLAEENARMASDVAAERARRIRREGQRVVSATYAAASKSGLTIEGSPLDVAAENAANAELGALDAEWEGESTARRYGIQAAQYRSSKQNPGLAAGLTLLQQGARVAAPYATPAPSNPYAGASKDLSFGASTASWW